MRKLITLALISVCGMAQAERVPLNGEWSFAADYHRRGETPYGWHLPSYKAGWDRVTVPHVWSIDPRFPYHVGLGWYRREFNAPAVWRDKCIRLTFEAVFEKAKVFLNGECIAEHQGGFTPFEIDISKKLLWDKPNLIAVCADNQWRAPSPENNSPAAQSKAWMEDGGIIRDVYLQVTPKVYVQKQKIEATPDLEKGTASVRVLTWVSNAGDKPAVTDVCFQVLCETNLLTVERMATVRVEVKPSETVYREMTFPLTREQTVLWGLDKPVLYGLKTTLGDSPDGFEQRFGIRSFTVRGSELLLNGRPVRLAGANRVAAGVDWGQNDPVEQVEKDMRLLKEAGCEFQRMHHVPLSPAVLNWADRQGMLLIAECSQNHPLDMDDAIALGVTQNQYREMIERDWNHPSVVAWSIGNEFSSGTPAGMRYTEKMRTYVKSMDSTRLVCFASNWAGRQKLDPQTEGSELMDFVCLNTYGAVPSENAENIDRARARWPEKPFVITEYGWRADRVGREIDREAWFAEMFDIFRKRPFISGAMLWTFNDYRSRYLGSNPDGYRWWGLVDINRTKRGSYELFRREMTPVELKEARMQSRTNLLVRLSARSDFPVYPPTALTMKIAFFNIRSFDLGEKTFEIPAIEPGKEHVMNIPISDQVFYFKGELKRGAFSMMDFGPKPWSRKSDARDKGVDQL